nr:DNA cytosine methyltransferase [Kitasatospora sp. MAA4]
MSGLRIGSLCTGYGGLDMAVREAFGGTVAWVADIDPGASAILAHHHPTVPNLGDITAVDWAGQERVDIVTAGFPCQDVSSAGLRAGLTAGTRSGLWRQVARAVKELKPSLVVIENVQGLLSARADGDVQPCPWCLGDTGAERAVRALGTVLADLAALGFDAEWLSLRASDVGAAHQRNRVFILAWPAHPQGPRLQGAGLRGRPAERRPAPADPHRLGSHRDGTRRKGRDEPAAHHLPAADPGHLRRPADQRDVRAGQPDAGRRAAADADRLRFAGHGQLPSGRDAVRRGLRPDPDGRDPAPADAPGDGRQSRWAEPARQQGGPDAALGGSPDWGPYTEAIARWASVCGRPAPRPTDDRGRLNPPFVEWLMGLDDGWVTAVPGLNRTAQLKALGNGVVPAQAAHALRILHDRATAGTGNVLAGEAA